MPSWRHRSNSRSDSRLAGFGTLALLFVGCFALHQELKGRILAPSPSNLALRPAIRRSRCWHHAPRPGPRLLQGVLNPIGLGGTEELEGFSAFKTLSSFRETWPGSFSSYSNDV